MGSSYRERGSRYSRSAARRRGFFLGGVVALCLLVYFYFRRTGETHAQLSPSIQERYQSILNSDTRSFQSLRSDYGIEREGAIGVDSYKNARMDKMHVEVGEVFDKQYAREFKTNKKLQDGDISVSYIGKYNRKDALENDIRAEINNKNDTLDENSKANNTSRSSNHKNYTGDSWLQKYNSNHALVVDNRINTENDKKTSYSTAFKVNGRMQNEGRSKETNASNVVQGKQITMSSYEKANKTKQKTISNDSAGSRFKGRTDDSIGDTNITKQTDTVSSQSRDNKTLHYEKDCVLFRTKYLNKTETKICQQNLDANMLFVEIIKDKVQWKMNYVNAINKAAQLERNLTVVDIGCGTGAFPLVISSNLTNTILAVDPYLENLKILHRALVAFGLNRKVKPILVTVSNISESMAEASDNITKTTLDELSRWHIQGNNSIVVLISQNGYELETLQGGKSFLLLYKICAVIVDFSFKRTLEKGPEITRFMDVFGFQSHKNVFNASSGSTPRSSVISSGVVFLSNKYKCASAFL